MKDDVKNGLRTNFSLGDYGTLVMSSRHYVPNNLNLKNQVFEKSHSLAYAMHPGSMKMYCILRDHY